MASTTIKESYSAQGPTRVLQSPKKSSFLSDLGSFVGEFSLMSRSAWCQLSNTTSTKLKKEYCLYSIIIKNGWNSSKRVSLIRRSTRRKRRKRQRRDFKRLSNRDIRWGINLKIQITSPSTRKSTSPPPKNQSSALKRRKSQLGQRQPSKPRSPRRNRSTNC